MKKFLTIFFLGSVFCAAYPHDVTAQDASMAEHMAGKILSEHSVVAGHTMLPMGVALDLEDEWYIYWKMPGDGGLATDFDWSKSKNVKDVKILWPTPDRISAMDLNSFGYRRDVIIPLEVTPQKTGTAVTLDLTIHAVACHDICVPQEISINRTLPARGNDTSEDKTALKDAVSALPATEDSDSLRAETVVLGKDSVAVPVFAKDGIADDADLIVETKSGILTQKAEIIRDAGDATRAVLKVKGPENVDLTKELFGQKTTVLVINGGHALEKDFSF